ncbi:putative phospholipid-transporting ATPase DNF3 [Ceratocystis fimbriata CBS 114723]|uniref:Phospholipid-transporting ATPase n=1 Tax=Ceratocystis fimbriata CBS 114723 TaxID=1035309 RepID=A0A2C5WXA3_9PEZI|nr:putative phospholipid-transporting ATPase DNF3 [Ceratocystis fimbriata CBS 114723]
MGAELPTSSKTASGRLRKKQKRTQTSTASCKRSLAKFYQKFIIETILRQKPLPPSKDGRHVSMAVSPADLVDERRNRAYITNYIRSSRYTVWDFLPKQLVFQFSKLANFYFLVIGILQMIPGLSTVGRYTTIIPLIIFVAFSMFKEGYDDYHRYLMDKVENRSVARVLGWEGRKKRRHIRLSRVKPTDNDHTDDRVAVLSGQLPEIPLTDDWHRVAWENIKVGDVIRLKRDDNVPADIVLLHATGPNGIAYIETMALDGETNLKSKQACPLLAERCHSLEAIQNCNAEIVSEDPNVDLYSYEGRVKVDGQTSPLTLTNIIFRGSTLRNTTEAIGIVVNSGEECKIRMNAHKHVRTKKPAIQDQLNYIVLMLVAVVCILSAGLSVGYVVWKNDTETDSWYIRDFIGSVPMSQIIVGYLIMFNVLVPLSLYVSMEIIKIGQYYFMDDIEMYDPVSDTPMVVNTTTILENLGQVNYVFSDKTGTLTENLLRFRMMSVAGMAFVHDMNMDHDEEVRRAKIEARRQGKVRGPVTIDDPEADESGSPDPMPLVRVDSETSTRLRSQSRFKPVQGQAELKTEDLLAYIAARPDTEFSRKARHFLMSLALCHTCLPENKNGEIVYQSASPDELALVEAAQELGFVMIDRPAQTITLQFPDTNGSLTTESYEVLDVIEFSSKRKRMSIIIRMPDGKICVFCKGADNVITERLAQSELATRKAEAAERHANEQRNMQQRMMHRASTDGGRDSFGNGRASFQTHRDPVAARQSTDSANYRTPRQRMARSDSEYLDGMVDERVAADDGAIFDKVFRHLHDFSTVGLRTLMFAHRYLEDDEYRVWKQKFHEASTSLENRQQKIEEVGELIEQKLELSGVTAIEDKLQDGVPETIDKLRRANIRVWMITGDRRETAINIGLSAHVALPWSKMYILSATGSGNLRNAIAGASADISSGMIPHSCVIIDGYTLNVVNDDSSLHDAFYELAVMASAVICCRTSPAQKASIVKRIRDHVPKSMTLAIGDGANDIGMIQASNVGIGISGREGLQAARTADYSIAQFRFLQRLLLVHGRWNYMRTGKYILATFWKEIAFFPTQAFYQGYTGYTGTSLYENWTLTVFNVLFTSLPVIALGVLDRDLKAETLLAVPELYSYGQQNKAFNFRKWAGWMFMGISQSAVLFFFTYLQYDKLLFDQDTSLYAMGSAPFTAVVIFINFKLLVLEMHSKTILSWAVFLLSNVAWWLWMIILCYMTSNALSQYQTYHAFVENFGQKLSWWATLFVILVAMIITELVSEALIRIYLPEDIDWMQRIEKNNEVDQVVADIEAQSHMAKNLIPEKTPPAYNNIIEEELDEAVVVEADEDQPEARTGRSRAM